MNNSDERIIEIANTIYHQLQQLNRQAGRPFKFSDAWADNVHAETDLQVTVKKTSGYEYKFFVKYDEGQDLYNVRFGYSYKGSDLSRDDWCVFYITDWTEGIYADMMLDVLQSFWKNRKSNEYHDIATEWKQKPVEPVEEISDYEQCLIAAGWIS